MADQTLSSRALDRQALGAFLLYLTLSLLFFGRGLIGHFSTWYIGGGPDSAAFMWFLNWWAYAATHRVNAILTKLLFAPAGVNLAWATTVPLAALCADNLRVRSGGYLQCFVPARAGASRMGCVRDVPMDHA